MRVVELEQDLVHARVDLNMAKKQVIDLATKLQDATNEGNRLRDAKAKLEQDVDGE
jgi:hypothetical protein